ncbi:hypothetical protein ABK040_004780 [Willaertia magna]
MSSSFSMTTNSCHYLQSTTSYGYNNYCYNWTDINQVINFYKSFKQYLELSQKSINSQLSNYHFNNVMMFYEKIIKMDSNKLLYNSLTVLKVKAITKLLQFYKTTNDIYQMKSLYTNCLQNCLQNSNHTTLSLIGNKIIYMFELLMITIEDPFEMKQLLNQSVDYLRLEKKKDNLSIILLKKYEEFIMKRELLNNICNCNSYSNNNDMITKERNYFSDLSFHFVNDNKDL